MALSIRLLLTLTTFVAQGGLTFCSSPSSSRLPEVPLVYVIKDESQASSLHKTKWDNQKLTIRNVISQQQEFPDPTDQRPAKQVVYSDTPAPYYHSYKYAGLTLDGDEQRQMRSWHDEHYLASKGTKSGTKSTSWLARNPAPPSVVTRKQQHEKPSVQRSHFNPDLHFPIIESSPAIKRNSSTRERKAHLAKKNLVCYYGSWAVYRPDAGKYPVENIDPFLCTHIIYGFAGLSFDNKIKPLDPWNDLEDNYGKGAMKRFTNLKRINPDLKALIAIGGWNEGSIKYSKMASEPEARATFVKSVLDFLAKYNFDGLDLDWEYPASRGGHSYDKQNFVKLLRELKEAFTPRNYLLTAAVSAGKPFIDGAYDIGQVSKYLDLINVMSYDYHGAWEPRTGMNAPLFSSKVHDSQSKSDALLNVNWSVNYWLQNGAPAEKIMLGVGSYGRSFTLDRAEENGLNAPANQKGRAGPYTREPGSLGYNEICEAFARKPRSWTIVRDPDYLAPYAYNDERQWVGYDDPESIALKAHFAKSMNLGGMMMWSLETDDFSGRCSGEKYPLLNTMRRVLDGNELPVARPTATSTPRPSSTTPFREVEEEEQQQGGSSTRRPAVPASSSRRPTFPPMASTRKPTPVNPNFSSTRRPFGLPSTSRRPIATSSSTTSSTTTSTTTRRPNEAGAEFVCQSDGMFADPNNCRKFLRCVSSQTGYTIYRFDCGPGTAFNEAQSYCDHIYNVPSCSSTPNSMQLRSSRNWYHQPVAHPQFYHYQQSHRLHPV